MLLYSGNILLSMNFRGAHMLNAFRTNVGQTRVELRGMRQELAILRADMIKWSVPLVGFGLAAKGMYNMTKSSGDLEANMQNVQMLTKSSADDMGRYRRELFEAQVLSKYTTADTFASMARMVKMVQGAKPGDISKVMRDVTAGQTLLELLPPYFDPDKTGTVFNQIINRSLTGAGQKTEANMRNVIQAATGAFMTGSFKNPDMLMRGLQYIPQGSVKIPIQQQMALVSTFANMGLMSDRGGATGGRMIEEMLQLIAGGSGGGKGAKAKRQAIARNMMGLTGSFDQFKAENGEFDIAALAAQIRAGALGMTPEKWEDFAKKTFGSVGARGARPLRDEFADMPNELVKTTKKIQEAMDGTAEAMIRLTLATQKGADEMMKSNITELGNMIGLTTGPSVANMKSWIAEYAIEATRWVINNENTTRDVSQTVNALVAGGTLYSAIMIGLKAGRFLAPMAGLGPVGTVGIPIAAGLGAAAYTMPNWWPMFERGMTAMGIDMRAPNTVTRDRLKTWFEQNGKSEADLDNYLKGKGIDPAGNNIPKLDMNGDVKSDAFRNYPLRRLGLMEQLMSESSGGKKSDPITKQIGATEELTKATKDLTKTLDYASVINSADFDPKSTKMRTWRQDYEALVNQGKDAMGSIPSNLMYDPLNGPHSSVLNLIMDQLGIDFGKGSDETHLTNKRKAMIGRYGMSDEPSQYDAINDDMIARRAGDSRPVTLDLNFGSHGAVVASGLMSGQRESDRGQKTPRMSSVGSGQSVLRPAPTASSVSGR